MTELASERERWSVGKNNVTKLAGTESYADMFYLGSRAQRDGTRQRPACECDYLLYHSYLLRAYRLYLRLHAGSFSVGFWPRLVRYLITFSLLLCALC